MTEADDDALDRASAPPLDFSALAASVSDAPADAFGTPDHRASASPSRGSRLIPGRGRGTKKDSASSAPPRTRRANSNRSKTPSYKRDMFVEPLESMYGYLGMMMLPFDPICGQAVIQSAHDCAVALDKLAETNGGVRRVLWTITQTSALGLMLAAHGPILMAIAMHHVPAVKNLMGGFGLGTESPEEPLSDPSPTAAFYGYTSNADYQNGDTHFAPPPPPPAPEPAPAPAPAETPVYVNPDSSAPVR